MIIALSVIAYFGVALLCVYLEGLITDDDALRPMWLVWPFMLPIVALAWLFNAVGELGERYGA